MLWKDNYYYMVNVYSSCFLIKKKELWVNLLNIKASYLDGEWIFGEEFNVTKNSSERKGRMRREVDNGTDLFCKFIDDSYLVDVSCKGKKYSWYSGNGSAMSRIDRLLLINGGGWSTYEGERHFRSLSGLVSSRQH